MLAFVLQRKDWREYDQIITFYTLETGRIEVLARGIKKILSKNSSFLTPGNLVEAEIIPGKELSHLGSVQPMTNFSESENNCLLSVSLDIFLNFVTHQERDERIFKLLFGWVNFLNQEKNITTVFSLDVFMIKFLGVLGFDIVQEEKVGGEIKKDLELISKGDWEIISRLKFEGNEADVLHNIVYQFALYHGQKRLVDWSKLAYFSGKC